MGTVSAVTELESLVNEWLTVPDIAILLDLDAGKVRRLLQERRVIGARIGERQIFSVPAAFFSREDPVEPVSSLHGTLTVLQDVGLSDEEAITWLYTEDETLPGRPVDALRDGRMREVRRRAQALAF